MAGQQGSPVSPGGIPQGRGAEESLSQSDNLGLKQGTDDLRCDLILSRTQIVILSPDAELPLLALDPGKVYCIGGIVDRTVKKGITLGYAVSLS